MRAEARGHDLEQTDVKIKRESGVGQLPPHAIDQCLTQPATVPPCCDVPSMCGLEFCCRHSYIIIVPGCPFAVVKSPIRTGATSCVG